MIYDCFLFFNELELLNLRLHELDSIVDRFVIVESTKTFTNQRKQLFFAVNKHLFKKFEHKIIHIVIDNMPDSKNPWIAEAFQRNGITRGLKHCKNTDIIMLSDVDEIPRSTAVQAALNKLSKMPTFPPGFLHQLLHWKPTRWVIKRITSKVHPNNVGFQQNLYYYFINVKHTEQWVGTRMFYYRDLTNLELMRHWKCKELIANGGWHFSYMGGVEKIMYKIQSFSHQEFNTDAINNEQQIKQSLQDNQDLFGRNKTLEVVPIDETYPKHLLKHLDKYASWIKN